MKSSSHLTRAVFRAIINNQPYIAGGCRRQSHSLLSKPARPCLPYVQRRTRMFGAIFNTVDRGFEGAKATPKNFEIALGRLVDLVRARRMQSRGPTDAEVLDAFRFLFNARLETQRRLTRNEVYLATEVFKHFKEKEMISDTGDTTTIGRRDLDKILKTLALPSDREKFRSDTKTLATMVFAALSPTTEALIDAVSTEEAAALMPIYVTILARTGSAPDALKLFRSSLELNPHERAVLWIEILKGLVNEGRHKEFNTLMREIPDQANSLQDSDYEELVYFLASDNNFNEAWRVYENQIKNGVVPTTEELKTLLDLCIRTNQLTSGKSLIPLLEDRLDEDGVLGMLFVWTAASCKDKEQIQDGIARLASNCSGDLLSMASFNRLIEYGQLMGKPDVIASALRVAKANGLQPDGKFYALQLKQAIKQGDLNLATETFEELIREDIPADNSDIDALNKFIAAVAFSPEADYNLFMRAIDYMLERNADFDAEALAGVCHAFLLRDELDDLTGLLRHRIDFYPGPDRARVSAVFQAFICNASTKDQRAFNAYELFRVAFPETPVAQRLPIMQSFFDRNRPDLACLVFGHMRQREDVEARPDADAYAKCFAGIAQCRDVDGLQMVYNMLKLDLEVELTTRVRNGLMLAYIACQMPYTAMIDHFWKIMDSREGPSYSTFEVALRACESWIPQGGYEARKIMAIVQAWNLEVTKEMYDCYIGAIAGQSEFENTIELIEEMENEIGERPDVYTIGAFYNAIPWQYRKDEVEKWAKKAYPDLWEELETFGDEIDEEWEIRYFKIDRTIDIEDPPLFAKGKYDPQISREAVKPLEAPPEKPQASEQTL